MKNENLSSRRAANRGANFASNCLLLFVAIVCCCVLANTASAATIAVTNTNNSGAGSLRQAILDANSLSGSDVITFNIAGDGVKTINLTSPLPTITGTTYINGYSQPGSSQNTLAMGDNAVLLIELNGASAGAGADGLTLTGGDCEIAGLVINRFGGSGIVVDSSSNIIRGNFIGTNATGTAALANSVGIQLKTSTGSTLGGNSGAERNVISGNTLEGVQIGGNANGVAVRNNYIGTNAAGNAKVSNMDGISAFSNSSLIIGGSGGGNLISGNGRYGVRLAGTQGAQVLNNLIGTAVDGVSTLRNGNAGIGIGSGAKNSKIGDTGAGNVIAFNGTGIWLLDNTTTGNHISSNSIHSNIGLGIDLGDLDAVAANDLNDADVGPNNLQNYPLLQSAAIDAGGKVDIAYSLNSVANTAFRVEIFYSSSCNPTGYGEGQTFINSFLAITQGNDDSALVQDFPAAPVGTFVTATATDPSGNTSEFSQCVQVTAPILPSFSVSDPTVIEGNSGQTAVVFNVTLSAPSNQGVGVHYETANAFAQNPAFEGEDYVGTSGILIFSPGETSKQVTVQIKGDTTPEPDEMFILLLNNNSDGATILKNQGLCTILNDDSDGPSAFQFGQNVYATPEDLNKVTITVIRTGDLSAAASVDYETKDGNATERGEYTTALGTLHFAAGEAQQSIDLLITEDSYDEVAEESLLLQLFNPLAGSTLGQKSAATVKILDDGPESIGNTNDDAEMFVRQHYHDFLNREADAAGLAFWQNELSSCGADAACLAEKRQNVSAAFFLSIEFQETGFLVHRLTETSFDKLPRYRDFVRDSREIAQGVVVGQAGWQQKLEANKQAFLASWVGRAEFTAKYDLMTNEQYVDALYANAGVVPEAAERQAMVEALNNQAATRASVLRSISESGPVMQNETNRAFVLMQYFGYLRRNPDDAPDVNMDGYNFWLTKLNQFGGDFQSAEMVKAFLISTEYRSRFGQP